MRVIALIFIGLAAAAARAETVTLTGRFSCAKCTAARVATGDLRPSNPVCARKCIDKGGDAVFLTEETKESLKVSAPMKIVDDLGYRVEVTGKVDRTAKTVAVEAVKRLAYEGPSCARPRLSR
jgi:hypothetical protein